MTELPEVGSVFVSNYPPYSAWRTDLAGAAEEALDRAPRPGARLGLYLHIPFCRRRCEFCYFRVYTDKDAPAIRRYLAALEREVATVAARPAIAGRPLQFVYFGGGTPSYLSVDQLRGLVAALQGSLPWTGAEEVTFECEPGTITEPKLEAIRGLGVTRLSLGIESYTDDVLRANGRAHLSAEIDRVRPWIRQIGFPQLNVDLIAGMLGESEESWRETVERTIAYDPDSVTVYQMELPYNTRFTAALRSGELADRLAGWETKRSWHAWAFDRFSEAGYEAASAYTVVKKGSGARFVYRDAVWNGADLVGAGVASFSHVSGVHFQNEDGWDGYLAAVEAGRLPIHRAFPTGEHDRLIRQLILKLKLGRVRRSEFRERFGVDPAESFRDAIAELTGEGLLTLDGDDIRVTREGFFRVDALLPRFYEDEYRDVRYT